jgi:3-hydroxybutyryl-CoA dehydrogenase
VIESVPERVELKTAVLADAERHVAPDTVLASNTSSISIDRLAAALRAPERFVGLHFFNPVHAMKLLELIVGSRTGDAAVAAGRELARRLGKEVVQVRDAPGFVTSRLGVVLGLEAARMLDEGLASAEDIDRAVEAGCGHPMGPLRLTDQVGLDVRVDIADALHAQLGGGQYAAPQLLRDKVAAGELGRKSGRGIYDYTS